MRNPQRLLAPLCGALLLFAGGCGSATGLRALAHTQGHHSGGTGGGNTVLMGRLRTIGFEAKGVNTSLFDTNCNTFEGGDAGPVAPSLDTAVFRSGAVSLKSDSGASNDVPFFHLDLTSAEQVLGRGYYFRSYVLFQRFPTSASRNEFMSIASSAGTQAVTVLVTPAGKLQLWNNPSNVQIGSDSVATLSLNTWYRIEVYAKINAGATDEIELRLDGTTVASGTGLNITDSLIGSLFLGWTTSPGINTAVNFDDVAINDDQGASQNSWPGSGKIVLLTPTADLQRGAWTGGAGGTTNLWDAVNNTPPVGVSAGTNTSQIATSTTAGNTSLNEYQATMKTYSAAGLVGTDAITLVQALINHGQTTTTGVKTGSVNINSNPTQAAADSFTFGSGAGANGTFPANWRETWGTAQVAPSVTLGTAPVLAVRKTDANAQAAVIDQMGIYVEYVNGGAVAGASPHRLALLGVGH